MHLGMRILVMLLLDTLPVSYKIENRKNRRLFVLIFDLKILFLILFFLYSILFIDVGQCPITMLLRVLYLWYHWCPTMGWTTSTTMPFRFTVRCHHTRRVSSNTFGQIYYNQFQFCHETVVFTLIYNVK